MQSIYAAEHNLYREAEPTMATFQRPMMKWRLLTSVIALLLMLWGTLLLSMHESVPGDTPNVEEHVCKF
jgi:hypothetical protein